jgi:two-component system, LytTR family, response regulator
MIRAVIVDDERNSAEALNTMLARYCSEVSVVGMADSADSAYELLMQVRPELAFLDIEMPFGNAFDLLSRVPDGSFDIIFVTAYDNYAINAIRYAALDYLLKPVNINELKQAVAKAVKRKEEKTVHQHIDILLHNLTAKNSSLQKIGINTQDGIVFLHLSGITCLEASNNYTRIFLKDKSTILASKTLKEFEEMLPADVFCRIHHSYMINLNCIKKYYRGKGGYVEMEDGRSIEVSIRKKEEFLSKINNL